MFTHSRIPSRISSASSSGMFCLSVTGLPSKRFAGAGFG